MLRMQLLDETKTKIEGTPQNTRPNKIDLRHSSFRIRIKAREELMGFLTHGQEMD